MQYYFDGLKSGTRLKPFMLLALLALMFAHLYFNFTGLYKGDDLIFARYAANLAHYGFSKKQVIDHFQLRWTPIYLTAAFYYCFGVNAFTTGLYSAVSVTSCAILLYKIIRRETFPIYALVMICFFFARSTVFYSHRLLADEGVGLSVLWMYFTYRKHAVETTTSILNGLGFAAGLLFGIMTKETIVIALPLFVYFLGKDLVQRRNLTFWKSAVPASLILICAYLGYFKWTTGDFLFRYHLLLAKSYMNICSFDQLPAIYTLKRIGYQLWQAWLLNGDLLIILPAICGVFYRKKLLNNSLLKTDFIALVILILSANFMTISWTSYLPLCHDPRHFLFILPFAALCAGPIVVAYFRQPINYPLLPIIFVSATFTMFVLNAGATKYLYLLCSLLFVLVYLQSRYLRWRRFTVYTCAFCLILFVNYAIDFMKPLYPGYMDNKKVMQSLRAKKNIPATVFLGGVDSSVAEYFMQFDTDKIRFQSIKSIPPESPGKLYYLVDGNLEDPVDKFVDSLASHSKANGVSIINKAGKVTLYEVNKAFLQAISGVRLVNPAH